MKKKREKGKREGVFWGEGGESSLSSPRPSLLIPTRFYAWSQYLLKRIAVKVV